MIQTNLTTREQHLKLIVRASEQTSIAELLANERKGVFEFPGALSEEIEDFTERNSLAIVGHTIPERRPVHKCCPRCLKAHIVKVSRELELNKYFVTAVLNTLTCETGHGGYYLDGERLVKF